MTTPGRRLFWALLVLGPACGCAGWLAPTSRHATTLAVVDLACIVGALIVAWRIEQ